MSLKSDFRLAEFRMLKRSFDKRYSTPSIDSDTSDWLNMIRGTEKSFLSQENSELSSLEFRVHFT